ncbi:3(2),5 -bisphosphate nucleotidase [Sulfurimonas gotlandica GD1]|uniref:3'(2'),5'-bisphosphate nucleotidase CysQ n=1 Tax=Sulfurimonas gotlandica (strain DSM 19862 / JCM 16533 / GD1) TaxID=929558 RepID=B6BKH5_SULGG|nr:3'(2'),5'-bisphosphate nucleotidase CysQ [Sulfurimonas gotlandica]EDZ62247.1 3'(2'),5'-bisphosphate nucleotidase [Sulfurimonas gotlandica GD1]EHP29030.1 3(2),5 -bisphosphate nucleotidase [Sulfurimonas gotlandica GD1]
MLKKINIKDIKQIALKAGKAIMDIYEKDFTIEYKDDNSPLTEADLKSNKIICDSLKKLYPEIPILSEENKEVSYSIRKSWEYYWCIDPIDGTKEFIKKNDEFTVNIALICKNIPVIGVVYAPALKLMYYSKQGYGAYKNNIKLPIEREDNKLIIVASRSHMSDATQKFVDNIKTEKEKELISIGSSLKLCLIAEGKADIYPRLAPTMEWDTAAAHAIISESGKRVVLNDDINQELYYNKTNLLNAWFIAN